VRTAKAIVALCIACLANSTSGSKATAIHINAQTMIRVSTTMFVIRTGELDVFQFMSARMSYSILFLVTIMRHYTTATARVFPTQWNELTSKSIRSEVR